MSTTADNAAVVQAVAAVAQTLVAIGGLIGLAYYARDTRKMRTVAQQQLSTIQEQAAEERAERIAGADPLIRFEFILAPVSFQTQVKFQNTGATVYDVDIRIQQEQDRHLTPPTPVAGETYPSHITCREWATGQPVIFLPPPSSSYVTITYHTRLGEVRWQRYRLLIPSGDFARVAIGAGEPLLLAWE